MTIKELKDFINSIDSKYDNEKIIINDNKYGEYCLGDGYKDFEIDKEWSRFTDKGFLIETKEID